MKKLATALCIILIVGCLRATAQDKSVDVRFQLAEHELAIEADGGKGIVTAVYLLKFDTATGQTWRYERRNWDDPTKQTSCFVAIPLEGTAGDGKEPGRFLLVARSGGKASQPFPDVLILDKTTGRVWLYRGIRQNKDGATTLNETFALVKDADPQK